MYSVVLAAMLTTGPAQAPEWFGCHGCHGCCGGFCHGCCGGYNAFSCCGGFCHGCCGGYSSCCGGCYGSCYGGSGGYPSYWSCSGTCFGCCNGSGWYSCCGGNSGYGFCSGSGWVRDCSAGWMVASCTGCSGSYPSYGAVTAAPVTYTTAPEAPPMPKLPEPVEKSPQVKGPAPATVIIKAPMDVRISVNSQPTERQSAEQIFTTPDLQPGKTYSYDFKAEVQRDGQTVIRTQTVTVRAGRESRVDFSDLARADTPAHVAIKAPADARVTVDGVEVPAAMRAFDTPALEAGRTYYYTVAAELTRGGRKVSDSRRVLVSAGQDVSVEFTDAGVTTAGK
jgi:uncharacterized protein (TIGR03000 family)